MIIEKQILHTCFDKAKLNLETGNPDKARDYLDMMIGYVAAKRSNGLKAKDKIEGVRVELWFERAWMTLENNNLML